MEYQKATTCNHFFLCVYASFLLLQDVDWPLRLWIRDGSGTDEGQHRPVPGV